MNPHLVARNLIMLQRPNSRRSSHTASGRAGWTQIAIPRCRVWTRGLRGGAAKALRRPRRACSGMAAYEKALLWCVRPEVAGQTPIQSARECRRPALLRSSVIAAASDATDPDLPLANGRSGAPKTLIVQVGGHFDDRVFTSRHGHILCTACDAWLSGERGSLDHTSFDSSSSAAGALRYCTVEFTSPHFHRMFGDSRTSSRAFLFSAWRRQR